MNVILRRDLIKSFPVSFWHSRNDRIYEIHPCILPFWTAIKQSLKNDFHDILLNYTRNKEHNANKRI